MPTRNTPASQNAFIGKTEVGDIPAADAPAPGLRRRG